MENETLLHALLDTWCEKGSWCLGNMSRRWVKSSYQWLCERCRNLVEEARLLGREFRVRQYTHVKREANRAAKEALMLKRELKRALNVLEI